MVLEPGGYRFRDDPELGLPLLAPFFVAGFRVLLFWPF
jgi:hypothetical protein